MNRPIRIHLIRPNCVAPMELIVNQLFSGLVRSALYFLVTSGLTLLFGVVGTLNMSHFSLYMFASYVTWTFGNLLKAHQFSFWLASLLCLLAMTVFALIIELFVMRRIYQRQLGDQLLITFALVFILDDVAKMIWGSTPLFLTRACPILTSIVALGKVNLPASGIFLVVPRIGFRSNDVGDPCQERDLDGFLEQRTRTKRCSLPWVFRFIESIYSCLC